MRLAAFSALEANASRKELTSLLQYPQQHHHQALRRNHSVVITDANVIQATKERTARSVQKAFIGTCFGAPPGMKFMAQIEKEMTGSPT